MGKAKGKIRVKVTPKKKAVKAKLSSGKGGIFTAKLVAIVKKEGNEK